MSDRVQRFTGKQLTTIVVAVAAAVVLMPVGVLAATSVVQIGDGANPSLKAHVVGGKLSVGDGSGAVTVDGTVKVNDGSGPMTVDGTVALKQPAGNYSKYDFATQTTNAVVYDIPANLGVAISSLTAAHEDGTGPVKLRVRQLIPTTAGNCTTGGSVINEITAVTVGEGTTVQTAYSPAILVPKNAAETCLIAFIYTPTGTQEVAVTATGWTY
ncbi:MAG: hypothetical protein QOK42_2562 [Frankiaceae bacterium]|nr:hypothetical protein [Frankiaceae bacterium]